MIRMILIAALASGALALGWSIVKECRWQRKISDPRGKVIYL